MLGIWASTFMTATRADHARWDGPRPRHVATPDDAPNASRPLLRWRRGGGRRG
jgi:hypothetical protein